MNASTLTDLNITWQAGQLRETKRGKVKSVVTGIPGQAFWHRYKHRAEFRAGVHSLGITVSRIAKGQWEAICWVNRHNRSLFEPLGIEIPDAPTMAEQPF